MMDEMNREITEQKDFHIGDIVKGKVTKVEEKVAFVDVGFKTDGILPISELSSLHVERASDVLSVGDELELKVIKVKEDEIVLSRQQVIAEKVWKELKEKFANHEVIEAVVADVVKGGLVVDLGVRGFIPASLVDIKYIEDFSDFKGKPVKVKIIELDEENNKLILSRRAVLEEEEKKKKREILESLEPGSVIEGKVQRITAFGAFVDINGVDGLVHISQMAHEHVESPADVVSEGDIVKVKVLSVDPENERISLSIKEATPGPWEKAKEQLKVGDIVTGTVKRLVSFGAFVELLPGVEGLVHISQISSRRIATPSEVLKENEEVKVKILDMNIDEKRISLSIREALEDEERKVSGDYHRQEEHSSFSIGEIIGDQLKKFR